MLATRLMAPIAPPGEQVGEAGDDATRAKPGAVGTVLLAEDDSGVRWVMGRALRAAGYSVLEAADGIEALRQAVRHTGPIHLLVADVVMPVLGGPALAGLLAKSRPAMRVLFVSGYPGVEEAGGRTAGAEAAFLRKPFTPSALAREVRAVLGQGAASKKEAPDSALPCYGRSSPPERGSCRTTHSS